MSACILLNYFKCIQIHMRNLVKKEIQFSFMFSLQEMLITWNDLGLKKIHTFDSLEKYGEESVLH